MTGPRLMGEKPTSPGNLGVNGWVAIKVVIVPNTAFPMKVGSLLAQGYSLLRVQQRAARAKVTIACPKHRRLSWAHRDRLIGLLNSSRSVHFAQDEDLGEISRDVRLTSAVISVMEIRKHRRHIGGEFRPLAFPACLPSAAFIFSRASFPQRLFASRKRASQV